MPHKVGFVVISSSSHEDNFSAQELMVHGPTVSGWRSARLCPYPQQVTLRLMERSRIRKLQLLAHQYMIPAKVEFHVGDTPADSSADMPGRFRRLGYVPLSDNEKTGFKARELKSVHVDAVATYLRLTFHGNHVNFYNRYNQVSLVAVNVLGDPVDGKEMDITLTRGQLIEYYLNSTRDVTMDSSYLWHDNISPLDDLAFDMYQDPEVAQIIRMLDEKKQEAVRTERYHLAKTLKQAISDLLKAGEHLGRYEVEKHCAIEKEDYDTAELKKQQMEEYRSEVYQQLGIQDLLQLMFSDQNAVSASNDVEKMGDPDLAQSNFSLLTSRASDNHNPADTSYDRSLDLGWSSIQASPQPILSVSPSLPDIHRSHPSPTKNVSSLPFDEIPLPVLSSRAEPDEKPPSSTQTITESILPTPLSHSPPPPHDSTQLTPPPSLGVTAEPEPLTEKAQREASLAIDAYGESLVAGIYSKMWSHREDAMLAVHRKLVEIPPGTPKDELRLMARAAVFLVRKALLDKVTPVFQASLKLLKMLVSQFLPQHKLGKAEMSHCVEQTWPNLLTRTGDSSSRLRLMAVTFIQEVALCREVRALQFIPVELVKPLKHGVPIRPALSRVELLEKLLPNLGTEGTGFTLAGIMQFATGALEHSTSEVREGAVRIIQAMYVQHKGAVLDFLPPDDLGTRKNIVYRKIFEGFARVNNSYGESLNKGPKVEIEKEEEIRALQRQLAAMKETSEKVKAAPKAREPHKRTKPGMRKTLPPSPPTMTSDAQPLVDHYLERLCIFCGERNDSFTEEGLDLHYWKHCAMLLRCYLCRQVVEIASLKEHLLAECEAKVSFSECRRCGEAVPREALPEHMQSQACQPPELDRKGNHCPLCHDNFAPGEEAWKSHLMGPNGCRQNARRTAALQRAQQAQAKGMILREGKPKPTVSPRGRPSAAANRLPAPRLGIVRTNHQPPVRR